MPAARAALRRVSLPLALPRPCCRAPRRGAAAAAAAEAAPTPSAATLFAAYPRAADIETERGPVSVPLRLGHGPKGSGGITAVGGLALRDVVMRHLRDEGQHVVPPKVVQSRNPHLADDPLCPVIVAAQQWGESEAGPPFTELTVYLIVSYWTIPSSFVRHPFAVLFMLRQAPAFRLYPLQTFISTDEATGYYRDVLRIPAVHAPVTVEADSAGRITAAGVDGDMEPPCALLSAPPSMRCPKPGIKRRLQAWRTMTKLFGSPQMVVDRLEPWRRVPLCIPHGRGPRKGYGIGAALAAKHQANVIAGVDLKDRAAMAHADAAVYMSANTSAWPCGPGDVCELPGALGFEAECVIQCKRPGIVRTLPQMCSVPLHQSDQNLYEMRDKKKEAQVLLAQRAGSELMEAPVGDRALSLDVIDLENDLRNHQIRGAFWNQGMSGKGKFIVNTGFAGQTAVPKMSRTYGARNNPHLMWSKQF